MTQPTLEIVTAVICDDAGRMMVVRKRGTAIFMKPGGKREPGEDDLTALARELDEELGCRLIEARLLGQFSAPAANEPSFTVRSTTYLARVAGPIAPRAEIVELAWIDPAEPGDRPLAALLRGVLTSLLVAKPAPLRET